MYRATRRSSDKVTRSASQRREVANIYMLRYGIYAIPRETNVLMRGHVAGMLSIGRHFPGEVAELRDGERPAPTLTQEQESIQYPDHVAYLFA
jgi:hypothetical protein